MFMRERFVAAVAVTLIAAGCTSVTPPAASPAVAPRTVTAALAAPKQAVFTSLTLRDPTVMQSFAYDAAHKVWVFAQLTWGKPASAGDLTLTRVSASGVQLGWMHLTGFGHGLAISAEPCGTTTCVWTEVHAVPEPALGWALAGSYGNQIARFTWHSGATLTPPSPGVERFGVNANAPEQTPSVNVAAGLIAVQYWSAGLHAFRWAVYNLAAFKKHTYTALARFTVPAALTRNGLTEQGWALAGTRTLVNWQGEGYSTANPPPGNATLSTLTTSGAVTSQTVSTAGAGLTTREPEGAAATPMGTCTGFASGPVGARKANIYCLQRDHYQPPRRKRTRPRRGHPVLRGEHVRSSGE